MEDCAEQKDWTFVDLVKQIYLTWDGPSGNDDKGHLLCNYLALMLTATIFVAFLVDFAQSVPSQRFIFKNILLVSSLNDYEILLSV